MPGCPSSRSAFQLSEIAPVAKTRGGEVRIADSSNFPIATNIAAALVTIHPGGMREMHWHPNADEWLYVIAGQGEATVFNTGPNVVTQNFNPGDVGYIKRAYGHYLRNTGKEDLTYLEVFRAPHVVDVSLSDWLSHTPRRHGRPAPAHRPRHDRAVPEQEADGAAGLSRRSTSALRVRLYPRGV